MKIGDVVTGSSSYPLTSGSSYYETAIVISVAPLILISYEGNMVWSTRSPEDVRVIDSARYADLFRLIRLYNRRSDVDPLEVGQYTINEILHDINFFIHPVGKDTWQVKPTNIVKLDGFLVHSFNLATNKLLLEVVIDTFTKKVTLEKDHQFKTVECLVRSLLVYDGEALTFDRSSSWS